MNKHTLAVALLALVLILSLVPVMWAAPGQDVSRQTVPTRTFTPTATTAAPTDTGSPATPTPEPGGTSAATGEPGTESPPPASSTPQPTLAPTPTELPRTPTPQATRTPTPPAPTASPTPGEAISEEQQAHVEAGAISPLFLAGVVLAALGLALLVVWRLRARR